MVDVTGKTGLVTGATGTIGGSIVRALHAQGATVTISGTRVDALNQLAGELGGRVHVLPSNLADAAAAAALATPPEAAIRHLDALSPNAALTPDKLPLT